MIADPELNVLDLVEGLVCVALQEVDPPNVLRWVKSHTSGDFSFHG